MIAPLKQADLPWLVDLAVECHAPFDVPGFRDWIKMLLDNPRVVAMRGEHTVAIAAMTRPAWSQQERNCELMHVFSRPAAGSAMEPVRALRAIDAVRRAEGCDRFFIVSTLSDLTPFARRLGARPIGSLHVLDNAA